MTPKCQRVGRQICVGQIVLVLQQSPEWRLHRWCFIDGGGIIVVFPARSSRNACRVSLDTRHSILANKMMIQRTGVACRSRQGSISWPTSSQFCDHVPLASRDTAWYLCQHHVVPSDGCGRYRLRHGWVCNLQPWRCHFGPHGKAAGICVPSHARQGLPAGNSLEVRLDGCQLSDGPVSICPVSLGP